MQARFPFYLAVGWLAGVLSKGHVVSGGQWVAPPHKPGVAEPPKINWISALTIIAKATLIQLARTSAVPRVKSRLKPRKTGIE